jgi:Na+/melibiose symporter-like transporter
VSLASSEQPAIGSSEFGTLNYAFLSILWLAFFAQWATVIPTIVPDQVRVILGPNGANYQELIAGGIIAASNVLALVIPPIAGALSDRSRSPRGRRRPFLIVGILGACVGLLLLLPFGQGDSPILYGLVILNLQLWWNWAAGPYAGLVTDMVPATGRVAASGWLNVMTIVGSAVGNGLMAALYIAGQPLRVVVIFIVINLLCLWITLVRVHEPPPPQQQLLLWV